MRDPCVGLAEVSPEYQVRAVLLENAPDPELLPETVVAVPVAVPVPVTVVVVL